MSWGGDDATDWWRNSVPMNGLVCPPHGLEGIVRISHPPPAPIFHTPPLPPSPHLLYPPSSPPPPFPICSMHTRANKCNWPVYPSPSHVSLPLHPSILTLFLNLFILYIYPYSLPLQFHPSIVTLFLNLFILLSLHFLPKPRHILFSPSSSTSLHLYPHSLHQPFRPSILTLILNPLINFLSSLTSSTFSSFYPHSLPWPFHPSIFTLFLQPLHTSVLTLFLKCLHHFILILFLNHFILLSSLSSSSPSSI